MNLRAFLSRRRSQLTYSARSVIAAVAALALAQALNLPLPLWAVLTAIIVTLTSDGRLLRAATDYFVGTIGGAIYGGAVGVLMPHGSEIATFAALVLTLVPLVIVAATTSSLVVAPITGVIVLLMPGVTHTSPIMSALDRVLEVALGGFTSLIVSFIILPSNVHRLFAEVVAHAVDQMAKALEILLGQTQRKLEQDTLYRLQDDLLQAVTRLSTIYDETERERIAHFTRRVETRPLYRTVVRLRHDLVMIANAADKPLSAEATALVAPVCEEFVSYLRSCAAALLKRRECPSSDPIKSALRSYREELAALRRKGLAWNLPSDTAGRFFIIDFAFEQMRHDVEDLARHINEYGVGSSIGNWFTKRPRSPTSLDDEARL